MQASEFKQRFLPLQPGLYRIAFALLGNAQDAEDVLQDVLTRLWEKRYELDSIENDKAYTITLVKHACLDMLRARKKWQDNGEEPDESTLSDVPPDTELENSEQTETVRQIIRQLPENQRQVLLLTSVEEMSNPEIEKLTGFSQANIRILLYRARQTIKEQLEKAFGYGRKEIR